MHHQVGATTDCFSAPGQRDRGTGEMGQGTNSGDGQSPSRIPRILVQAPESPDRPHPPSSFGHGGNHSQGMAGWGSGAHAPDPTSVPSQLSRPSRNRHPGHFPSGDPSAGDTSANHAPGMTQGVPPQASASQLHRRLFHRAGSTSHEAAKEEWYESDNPSDFFSQTVLPPRETGDRWYDREPGPDSESKFGTDGVGDYIAATSEDSNASRNPSFHNDKDGEMDDFSMSSGIYNPQ